MRRVRMPAGRRRAAAWGLALVVALTGAVLVVVAVAAQEPAPPRLDEPRGSLPRSSGTNGTPEQESEPPPDVTPANKVPLPRSRPVSISIPAVDVRSQVFAIGKAADGTLAVPQPGPRLDQAAWFENSPTPGQPGPSVIEGHVSTDEGGPSVFFDLADLRPGDRISVDRHDGTTAVFTVDALREFPKDHFPTRLVYGGGGLEPTLRLITCSGFDPAIGHHTSNLVVFSTLTRVERN